MDRTLSRRHCGLRPLVLFPEGNEVTAEVTVAQDSTDPVPCSASGFRLSALADDGVVGPRLDELCFPAGVWVLTVLDGVVTLG